MVRSLLLILLRGTEDGLSDTPRESTLLFHLLPSFLEVLGHCPADRGVSLRFGSLLVVLQMLLWMLFDKLGIGVLAFGLFLYKLWLEGAVHCVVLLVAAKVWAFVVGWRTCEDAEPGGHDWPENCHTATHDYCNAVQGTLCQVCCPDRTRSGGHTYMS